MTPNFVVGAINLANQVKQTAKTVTNSEAYKAIQNKSLIDIASPARVEPIVMVDADCLNVESLGDVMQVLHSMFAGYYLQAVNMVNTVGGVSVAERLAPLNPTAGASSAFEEMISERRRVTSLEDMRFKLPGKSDQPRQIAFEDMGKEEEYALNTVRDASNLAVGKVFNVTLGGSEGSQCVTVPVAIRLMVNTVPSRVMVDLFSNTDAFDNDLRERYHAWRSGRIEFIKDLILCNDLINKRVRSAVKDPSGILSTLQHREAGSFTNALLSGKASVAAATNLAVVSSETMAGVEAQVGGPMKNTRVREAMFDATNLMIVAVVNKQWERVSFWFRGLDTSTTLSYRDLKTAGKSDGGNVVDILKAYISGAAPMSV